MNITNPIVYHSNKKDEREGKPPLGKPIAAPDPVQKKTLKK